MSIQDAVGILKGGDTAATQYFRTHTETQLTADFLPIVRGVTEQVELAQQYNKIAKRAARMGLIDNKDTEVETYVTGKAMDGLFSMIADEEKLIRKDPVSQGSKLIGKVFRAIFER